MNDYENVIVADCDGVLLFWEHGFNMWMRSMGYKTSELGHYNIDKKYGIDRNSANDLTDRFNQSAGIGHLPPVRDAIKYVRKLHEDHGYVFHVISAVPNDPHIYEARMKNLKNVFGETPIEKLILCNESKNKKEHLEEYRDSGCFWLEDLVDNAKWGADIGMRALLVDHHYNKAHEFDNDKIKRVSKWSDIYSHIVGDRDHEWYK